MENKKFKYFYWGLCFLGIFTGGFFLGKFVFNEPPALGFENNNQDMRDKGKSVWNFINPLLDCGEFKNISNKNILDLRDKVSIFVEQQKNEKKVESIAVYFRDLNNGPWFGISEKENFYPASLLKVPLMMSVLKQAMDEPSFLGKQFIWQGESKNNEYFKADDELKYNQTYSMGEALTYMIKYSDNNATDALAHNISKDGLVESYSDLGIELPKDNNYQISVRAYASFFRVLFNSTFLSKEYSEDALHLLSDTVFNQGLVKGVPPSIKVAHKFGERQLDNSDIKNLHDCGIIYYPSQPYLLCVMAKGKDFNQMATTIAGISKVVYNTIDKEVGLKNK